MGLGLSILSSLGHVLPRPCPFVNQLADRSAALVWGFLFLIWEEKQLIRGLWGSHSTSQYKTLC